MAVVRRLSSRPQGPRDSNLIQNVGPILKRNQRILVVNVRRATALRRGPGRSIGRHSGPSSGRRLASQVAREGLFCVFFRGVQRADWTVARL